MNRVAVGAAIWLLSLGLAIAQSRYAGTLDQRPAIEYRNGILSDPVIFQTLKQDAWLPGEFSRPDRCLSCHLSANSLDVPGILVRRMFTARDGRAT